MTLQKYNRLEIEEEGPLHIPYTMIEQANAIDAGLADLSLIIYTEDDVEYTQLRLFNNVGIKNNNTIFVVYHTNYVASLYMATNK